jgi:hypothetical protein
MSKNPLININATVPYAMTSRLIISPLVKLRFSQMISVGSGALVNEPNG